MSSILLPLFEGGKPWETNLCALFWRCVLLTPMKLAGWGLLGLLLSVLATALIEMIKEIGAWVFLRRAFLIVSVAFAIGSAIWLITRPSVKKVVTHNNPVASGVRYVKANYCPRIEIRH